MGVTLHRVAPIVVFRGNIMDFIVPDNSMFWQFSNKDKEECGIVFLTQVPTGEDIYAVSLVRKIPNHHKDPRNEYQVNKSDVEHVLELEKPHGRRFAVLHTHIANQPRTPGYDDVKGLPDDGTIGVVYHLSSGELNWFDRESGWLATTTIRRP